MRYFARLILIVVTVLRFGVDEVALSGFVPQRRSLTLAPDETARFSPLLARDPADMQAKALLDRALSKLRGRSCAWS